MADGEVIQRASERALSLGTSLSDVLDCVDVFRQKDLDTPVVLMGYCNPFQRMGLGTLAARCNEVGADGVLVVDLPQKRPLLSRVRLNRWASPRYSWSHPTLQRRGLGKFANMLLGLFISSL